MLNPDKLKANRLRNHELRMKWAERVAARQRRMTEQRLVDQGIGTWEWENGRDQYKQTIKPDWALRLVLTGLGFGLTGIISWVVLHA